MSYPNRDSGVFLYTGWRILNGELPYRDIWDHKPPLIYYINALGLTVSQNSVWGVWLLEWVGLSVAAYLGFRLLRTAFGTLPALVSTFLWLLTFLLVLTRGNLTEEYALPLQFASLYLVSNLEARGRSHRTLFVIGVLSGLAFFTKQTTIGLACAIGLYLILHGLLSHRKYHWLSELAALVAGGVAVCVVVVAFFAVQGALSDFWSAVFAFNFTYAFSSPETSSRGVALLQLIYPLAQAWLLEIVVVGYVVGLFWILRRGKARGSLHTLLAISLIDLPVEVLLVAMPGRVYPHYLISILPVFAVFYAVPFSTLFSRAPRVVASTVINAAVSFAVVAALLMASSATIVRLARSYADQPNLGEILAVIRNSTCPSDTVLVWGNEVTLNFEARRRSPTRFAYQYPLYQVGYADAQITAQFLSDLQRNRPRLIVDSSNAQTPFWDFPVQTPAIRSQVRVIKSQYALQAALSGWTVYTYADHQARP